MKAGSVLLGRGAAEARDQDVRPGAGKVEDDEALFSISEFDDSINYEQLLTGNRILQAE